MYEPSELEQTLRDAFIFLLMFLILVGNTLIIAAYKRKHQVTDGLERFHSRSGCFGLPGGRLSGSFVRCNFEERERQFLVNEVLYITGYIQWHRIRVPSDFRNSGALHRNLETLPAQTSCSRLVLLCFGRSVGAVAASLLPRLHADASVNSNYPFYVLLTVFVLALLVISLLNALTFKITKSLIHNTVEPAVEITRTRANLQRKIRRERRTAATLAMISGAFFITWLPHVIGALVFTSCFPCNLALVDIGRVGAFIKCMQYANSALNPFVFAFRDAEMRMTIKTLTRACWNVVQPYIPTSRIQTTMTQTQTN
ncbi:hypothetical protein OS493_012786 [Desmophyllum pertusum]|uniref:G-protein coupled receptors family 1 profile domain-containing protein n=1 Tax=Desmophyllum pertusum TaxID=174260 RepID=A0A9X0D077_9CNID|nr:hypothetical protein OS493_012786 [Desmophyllum pertusum]